MFTGLACTCFAQKQYTTPVPILKQINRHNEDGSYSYGYEAADGSFKIETKSASGEVKGKYGYVDDSGNVREIEYGANKNGFQPTGDGINVAPPTFDNRDSSYPALQAGEIDDGQYREDRGRTRSFALILRLHLALHSQLIDHINSSKHINHNSNSSNSRQFTEPISNQLPPTEPNNRCTKKSLKSSDLTTKAVSRPQQLLHLTTINNLNPNRTSTDQATITINNRIKSTFSMVTQQRISI